MRRFFRVRPRSSSRWEAREDTDGFEQGREKPIFPDFESVSQKSVSESMRGIRDKTKSVKIRVRLKWRYSNKSLGFASDNMIKSFKDKTTENIFNSKRVKGVSIQLAKKAKRRLEFLHSAVDLEDMYFPPSNRFHALEGFAPT
ncbi:type II toxin-antitoxin system RelE/ParE family toxin [bacterium]|nr:type II toxin-antitoxin system RelE/ParE family toxin [bacterium]